jgi:hypothetical protein
MKILHNKRLICAIHLTIGDQVHPRSNRPSGSFLRTQWRVASVDQENRRVLLKLGRQCRFIDEHDSVLIDAPAS